MCENLSENEARLLILEQIQFLRVLTRKLRFSVNMWSQKGHKYWKQSYLQPWNVSQMCHIYEYWKSRSFEYEKISLSPDCKFLAKKRGNREKFEVVLCGGPNLKIVQHIITIKLGVVSKFE